MLVNLENAGKVFANRVLFLGATAKIEEGDRIGVVGSNGSGKSTLLSVICGEADVDSGSCMIARGVTVGLLDQQSSVNDLHTIEQELRTAFTPLLEAQERMEQLAAKMAKYQDHTRWGYKRAEEEYNQAIAFFETNEGYQIDAKIQSILNGMGFADRSPTEYCGNLSGGEKTRLAMAKLLLQQPDLLLLDEPTNHLDFPAIRWLETFLQGYKGTFVVVSHDRYFLDKICNRIWELEYLRLTVYKGNYSKFLHTRAMIYDRQQKEYEMQQAQVTKLTDYIARNKARASTAGMAKSKEKELARIEVIKKPPRPIAPVRMHFRFEYESTEKVLEVENLSLSVGEGAARGAICSGLNLTLRRGDKVAIVGRNGVGKSSFFKALLGELVPDGGKMTWGRNLRISYFEQEQTDLHSYKTVMQELWDRFPQTYEQDVRNLLGALRFSGDEIEKEVYALSGGEKARLKFAIMMNEGSNLLILDEPTNHLDLTTKEALDTALMEFSGTVLMISHDRYLLSRVPTRIVELHPDGFRCFEGGYEQYLAATEVVSTLASPREESEKKPPDLAPAVRHYRNRRDRAELVALRSRLIALEQEISDLEYAIASHQQQMMTPGISNDYEKVAACCLEIEKFRAELGEHMEEWTELSEQIEAAEAQTTESKKLAQQAQQTQQAQLEAQEQAQVVQFEVLREEPEA